MLNTVALGTYYPGKSILHRLQARTKLLTLIWISISLVLANQRFWHYAPILVILTLFGVGMGLSGVPLREFWRRMRLLLILLLIGAIPLLFTAEDDARILYSIGLPVISYGFARVALLVAGFPVLLTFLSSLLPIASLHVLWKNRRMRRVRRILVLLLVVIAFAYWLLWGPAAATKLPFGPLTVLYGGTWLCVISLCTLLILYGFSLLLTMTTSPVTLIEGLTILLAPLRRLKLPVDDFALMTLLALRFIPTLFEEIEQLRKAQTARGADIENGTLRQRLQSVAMLFIPLIRSTLRRADELATALEARGYEVEGQQTPLHESRFGLCDYIVMITVVLLTAGAFLL